jgi:histidinol-phosphatase (PHP family)
MLANYHVHTSRCRHAIGTDEEYVQKAIAEGIKILGFSDHAPYLYPNGYTSYYKMLPEEADEYFASLSALREKYSDKIKIYIGYEAEFYTELWDKTLEFWKSANRPEYLLLGQHYLNEEYKTDTRIRVFNETDRNDVLSLYVDTVIKAVETGKFSCIAHPDVINFVGDEDFYLAEMSRLLEAVRIHNIPIELNTLGLASGRHYPNPKFWELASRFSVNAILGCDAHSPERVGDRDELINALRFADKYNINVIEEINLINPFDR